ncbi:hypothetical protein SRABI128_06358 [Microbacterium sp. Bi128]|nr:hypothetical protein SRABI128_06358 [Microbacterium sp. Bi128]
MALTWLGTGVPMIVTMLCRLSAKPNSSAAKNAPIGFQRPRIMAARAMKPRPPEISLVKLSIATRVKNDPPIPATAPPSVTFQKRVALTLMPRVSAACGCSPTARTRRPHFVLNSATQITMTATYIR